VALDDALTDSSGIPAPRIDYRISSNTRRLMSFLREVKSGAEDVPAPVYSHVEYDIVPGESVSVRQPDILILEGLNVLQVGLESNEFVFVD